MQLKGADMTKNKDYIGNYIILLHISARKGPSRLQGKTMSFGEAIKKMDEIKREVGGTVKLYEFI